MTSDNPKWNAQAGDLYFAVSHQIVGNPESGYGSWYRFIAGPFERREAAWRRGCAELGHDDFNLAVVRGGSLVAVLWDDELVDDDPDVLANVSAQTGVGVEANRG